MRNSQIVSEIIDLQNKTTIKTSRVRESGGGRVYTIIDYKNVNEVVQMILDYLGVEIEDAKPHLVKRGES